jgi:hypothetical protein
MESTCNLSSRSRHAAAPAAGQRRKAARTGSGCAVSEAVISPQGWCARPRIAPRRPAALLPGEARQWLPGCSSPAGYPACGETAQAASSAYRGFPLSMESTASETARQPCGPRCAAGGRSGAGKAQSRRSGAPLLARTWLPPPAVLPTAEPAAQASTSASGTNLGHRHDGAGGSRRSARRRGPAPRALSRLRAICPGTSHPPPTGLRHGRVGLAPQAQGHAARPRSGAG